MFTSLKKKIKEETGSELPSSQRLATSLNNNNNRMRSRYSSTISINSNNDDQVILGSTSRESNHMSDQMNYMRSNCNELSAKVNDLTNRMQLLQEEKNRVEKTNEILLETVKVAQTQKDIYCEEQEKIQNLQREEIDRLKSLLSFREQEAVDRLGLVRQNQQQIENLTSELERLKQLEPMVDSLQDELQQLRHSSQQEKNNLTTSLAAAEEENRHLKKRLQIVDQTRLETISALNKDEKVQTLVQERKLLEQHLEEAHLQLSDIKSSWSGQNLALETQVSRLSKQVAEETTEKRKAIKARDDLTEKVKQLEFQMQQLRDEIQPRDDKIKLLEEELDELNLALKECREDNEQQSLFERNKAETLQNENSAISARLTAADERFTEYATNAEHTSNMLRQQKTKIQEELTEAQNNLEKEREEKLTALLKNAEISQREELLKQELRIEREETNELQEKQHNLEQELKQKENEINQSKAALEELETVMHKNDEKLKEVEEMQRELIEKNKTIKVLNQRLADLKKTLKNEFNSTRATEALRAIELEGLIEPTSPRTTCTCAAGSATDVIVMDEVNFKYLKHVIVKFLTSREVEAMHLIRAVATLLKLSKDEEKLLYDTLSWKMSWFGTKPDHGSGQRSVSIPPS